MYEPEIEQRGELANTLRMLFGFVLILFGIGVALWIVISLVGLVASDSTPGLVSAVMPDQNEAVKFGLPDGELTIPHHVFKTIGYVIVCFIYAIGAGVAATLIGGGTSLWQPDVGKLLQQLLRRTERQSKDS